VKKSLTPEQLKEAEALFREGYSNRQIARHFGVAKTTIWENIYAPKERMRVFNPTRNIYLFATIKSVILIVSDMRNRGLNSDKVAQELQMPLEEVNHIYSQYPLILGHNLELR